MEGLPHPQDASVIGETNSPEPIRRGKVGRLSMDETAPEVAAKPETATAARSLAALTDKTLYAWLGI